MRKQTKLAVVLSAAALLAIGASMTSFAKGWTEEDGEWVYLDKYGDRVYEEWQKSGDNVYYLDEDGVMATGRIVEYKDAIYYVNENGVKVTNQWVAVDNEDDITVDTKEVDTLWYYFGSNGKAYKASANELKVKDVPYAGGTGKFVFDSEGHMVSGWTEIETKTGYDLYYLGDENQGWAVTGWQYLEPDAEDYDYEDEEWYYFGSNGKATKANAGETKTKYISGRYYTFDENGVLIDDWYGVTATDPEAASGANAYTTVYGSGDGWVYTTSEADPDGDEYWFYLVTVKDNGKTIARGVPFNENGVYGKFAAKTIKGKTYLFDSEGKMKTGKVELTADTVADTRAGAIELKAGVYYFSKVKGSAEGQMQTGKVTVTTDGEDFYYYFRKKIEKDANGDVLYTVGQAYENIVKDGCYYDAEGKRVNAEDGNSYELVVLNDSEDVIVDGKYLVDADGNKTQRVVPAGALVAVNASGRIKTSGSVRIDGTIYDINADTYAATVRPDQD